MNTYMNTFMKKIILLTLYLSLVFSTGAFGNLKEKIILTNILDKIQTYHFDPKPIDDKFSQEVFDLYINRLDPAKQFFIQDDINKLKEYELLLDDQLLKGGYSFHLLAQHLFAQRIKIIKAFYKDLLKDPFTFSEKETITIDHENAQFTKSEDALKQRWKKRLKYQTLTQYISLVEADEKVSNNLTILHPKLEKKARKSLSQEKDILQNKQLL